MYVDYYKYFEYRILSYGIEVFDRTKEGNRDSSKLFPSIDLALKYMRDKSNGGEK
jgi:hypothetical protein